MVQEKKLLRTIHTEPIFWLQTQWQEFPMSRELESKIGSKIAMTPQSISSDVIALGGFDDLDSNPLGGIVHEAVLIFSTHEIAQHI